ncbi:MAG: FAD/NAD(P)-binding protein [Rhodospirillales bacterium]|nr:FAD/NAD(P)-binding protein [Rhodospirillales bacterium]
MRAVSADEATSSWDLGMVPRPFRVRKNRRELNDVVTLELEPESGEPMAFEPGQFTMLYLHGIGEIPISISGDPSHEGVLVQTIRSVGAVSEGFCNLSEGDMVGVRGPFGRPWPVEKTDGKNLLIMAGGLGLAPVRPAVYWALQNMDRIKKLNILYGARTPDDALFPSQLLGWEAVDDVKVLLTVDRPVDDWYGRVGVVTDLIADLDIDPQETIAMVCGPDVMMNFTIQSLRAWGLDGENVYVSLERNMKCAIGWCGHCQMGPHIICHDGPVFSAPEVAELMSVWEL